MEAALSGGTDPYPYIIGAYAIGVVLLLGFGLSIQSHRAKLRTLLSAIRKN